MRIPIRSVGVLLTSALAARRLLLRRRRRRDRHRRRLVLHPVVGPGDAHLHHLDPRHRGRRRRSGTTRTRTSRSRCRPARTATAARTRTSSTSSRPATRPTSATIEYDAMPSFRVQDGLVDLGGCDIVAKAKDQFVDWTWNQVSFGEDGHAYGVPQDTGPMALFYREDLFEKAGIADPDHLGRVRRGGREGQGRRRLHHQLLAERHQPVRRARPGRPAAAGSPTTASSGRSPWTTRAPRRSPTTGRA